MESTLDRRSQHGFTFIELAVTLAILALLGLLVVVGVRALVTIDLGAEARTFAEIARFARNSAVMRNVPCRLVVDMEERAYWVEAFKPTKSKPRFLIDREELQARATESGKPQGDVTEEEKPTSATSFEVLKIPGRRPDESQKFQLKKTLKFKAVMTPHQDTPTEAGRAEIYFFPNGFAEHSYVYMIVQDEDAEEEDLRTVEILALQGHMKIHREEMPYRDIIKEQ